MNSSKEDPGPPATKRQVPWQIVASVAIVALSALLSVLGAVAAYRFEEDHLEVRIDRRADNVSTFLSERITPVGRSVAALMILFENSEQVSHEEFTNAARTLLAQNPEIGVFQWIPRVEAVMRDQFLATVRGELSDRFEIVDVTQTGSRTPAPVRSESWPITYIEPFEGNETAWGFDLAAGHTAGTLRAARDAGQLLMGPPRRLVQDPEGGAALFFIQPVFSQNGQAKPRLLGFIQGISAASRVLSPVIELADANGLDFELADITDGEAEPFLSTLDTRILPGDSRFLQEYKFTRLGRTMRLRCIPTERLLQSQQTYYSQAALIGGLLGTAMLALYLVTLLRRTSTIQRLVERRTEELTESNRNLAREAEQRRAAEATALRAQENFKFIVDSVDGIVWQVDIVRDRIVFVNRRAQDLLGYPAETWLGEKDFWVNHLHPDDRDRAVATFREGVERGGGFEHSYRMIAESRGVVWLNDYVRLAHLPGQPRLAHVISFDVTRQRAAEELLERDAHFLSNVDDALIVSNLEGNVTFWNHGAEKVFGWTEAEVLGKQFKGLFSSVVAAAIERNFAAVAKGDPWSGEWTERRKDGSRVTLDSRATRYLDRDGKPAGIFTISRDITERRAQERERAALESKLQHTQKLESLGVLAGGIAHDFNNLLTGILGHSSLLAMDLPADAPMASSVAAIEQSALRAAALCQQMLAYAGRGKFVIEPVSISEIVRDTAKLFETSVAKNATIEYALRDDIPPVRADSTQLRQVVMNLVINAAEALSEAGGRVVVSTGTVVASRAMLDAAVLGHDRAKGTYVFLEVADTGCGIKPEHLRRIFEPFYSTKFTGRGLGLAAVLGIVRGHDGALTVTSSPENGTKFLILLPPTAAPAAAPDEKAAEPDRSQGGTILVIDDERFVREAAATILQKSGCTIENASGGQEGISKFESDPDRYDVVLLDLTMPGMHGVEVLRHLRAIRPSQPVIVMSGFTADEAAHRFEHEMPDGFLEKPFRASALLSSINEFLARRRTG
ncbi:MAG TPA: CHASE domain-containing protein [Opitutaceae bacterium]